MDREFPHVADLMRVEYQPGSERIVARVSGEIDLSTAQELDGRLLVAVELARPDRQVVVDLRGVRFCGAAGLNVLLRVLAACQADALSMLLVANRQAVLRPLRAVGLDRLFTVVADLPKDAA